MKKEMDNFKKEVEQLKEENIIIYKIIKNY